MQLLKQEYRQFLNENFNGLQLRKPLFYNWDVGIRFNLQVGDTDTDEYFEEVLRRATTIFQSVFDKSDQVFFVFIDYKYKRRKIRFSNYAFRQVTGLKRNEVSYTKIKGLYYPSEKFDKRNIAITKLTIDRINFKNILTAIGNADFGRQPALDTFGGLTDKEIYFVNIDKKIIFHMYDDRGLDLIASDKKILQPIYLKYNDWILNYDRKRIDEQFM